MRLVVDANIILSALLRDGATRELVLHAPLELFAPERLATEVARHVDEMAQRSQADRLVIHSLVRRLLDRIQQVPAHLIQPHAAEALHRCRRSGRKDAVYVACCLAVHASLWTHDRRLSEEAGFGVVTTHELLDRFLL